MQKSLLSSPKIIKTQPLFKQGVIYVYFFLKCKMVWSFCVIWKILWELASGWAKFCEILSHSVRYGRHEMAFFQKVS